MTFAFLHLKFKLCTFHFKIKILETVYNFCRYSVPTEVSSNVGEICIHLEVFEKKSFEAFYTIYSCVKDRLRKFMKIQKVKNLNKGKSI